MITLIIPFSLPTRNQSRSKKETFNGNNFVPLKVLYSYLKLHAFLFFEQCRHILNKFFDVPLVDQFSGLTVDFCQMEATVIDCK